MKNILFLILITLLPLNFLSQTKRAVIYLKDGTKKKGIARFSNYCSNVIMYKKNKNSKLKKLTKDDFYKVILIKGNDVEVYEFKTIKNPKGDTLLLKFHINGHLNLYSLTDTVIYNNHSAGVKSEGFGNISLGTEHSATTFFLSRKNSNIVDYFPIHSPLQSFKKKASKYFKDCPKLVEKIRNKEYQQKHIFEIVTFYNLKCSSE